MSDQLKVPDFKSTVPEVLRHKMTGDELNLWVADQLSIQTQTLAWMGEKLVETHRIASESAATIAHWKSNMVDPVKIVIAVLAWALPIAVALLAR